MTEASLPVMEHFYTIQGEGAYVGHPAYFVRLGGCDVGCHWCDVKESWDASLHPEMTIADIVSTVKESGAKLAVITGGEPLIYHLDTLTSALSAAGIALNIETSGAHPFSGKWDWVCFSPKKFKEPLPEFYQEAHELKIIIFNQSDFKWAEGHAEKINSNCRLFLQTEWDKRNEMMPLIIEYVKQNPKWNISVQTHKYLDIP